MRVHSLGYRCLHGVQYPKFIITMAERVLDSYDRVYLLGREDPYFLRGWWTPGHCGLIVDIYVPGYTTGYSLLKTATALHSSSNSLVTKFDSIISVSLWYEVCPYSCVYFWISALRTSLSSLPQFKAFKATYVKLLILWPNESGSCYAIKMSFSIWHHHI